MNDQPTASLYAWEHEQDGRWGIIADVSTGAPFPLVTREVDNINHPVMREIAEFHHAATGHPVRLARYEVAETMETLP